MFTKVTVYLIRIFCLVLALQILENKITLAIGVENYNKPVT